MNTSKQYSRYIPDNRVPDNFDKIRTFYIEGKKLSNMQEKKRLQYEEAHHLQMAGYSKHQVVKILKQKKIVGDDSMGYDIVNGAEILFGNVAASNKEGTRVILTENFLKIYQWALKNENIKEANRALENVAKINNLFKEDNPINWDEIVIPVPVYTSNPQALKIPDDVDDSEIFTEN